MTTFGRNWLVQSMSVPLKLLRQCSFFTTAQACRLLFSSSQLMPASLFSCTDTRQNNLITRLCFICYTVHNFCCFLPAWYSQNTCRHDTTVEGLNKSTSLSCCENSLVPRMIPLIHPAKIIDLVESKSKDIG